MPESRLPIEICELVIDNLDNDDDKEELRACSLACKAFLPATRRILFYFVDLIDRETTESFLDIICSLPSSTSPCRYVRKLFMAEGRRGDEDLWMNKALPVLAERLLDVTILEFDNLLWKVLDDDGRKAILSGFLNVNDLDMAFSLFETSEQMNRFIASFPSLADLYCSESYWEENGPLTATLPQSLQIISLDSDTSPLFHRLLSRESQANRSVRTLKFYHMYREDIEDVGKLLKTLGSSLEELRFGHLYTALGDKQCDAEAVFLKDINLAHNTHLRSFDLKIFHRNVSALTWVITLLSQITSPYLVELCLEFQLDDDSLLNTIEWTHFADVFNQQQWSKLQELRVHWYGYAEKSAVNAFIKAHFSVLESRGVLRIVTSSLYPEKFQQDLVDSTKNV